QVEQGAPDRDDDDEVDEVVDAKAEERVEVSPDEQGISGHGAGGDCIAAAPCDGCRPPPPLGPGRKPRQGPCPCPRIPPHVPTGKKESLARWAEWAGLTGAIG